MTRRAPTKPNGSSRAFVGPIAGLSLSAYVSKMAWREGHRRVSNGVQYLAVATAALAHPVSRTWKG